MANPYSAPTLTGYNAIPGTDTGSAGGTNNVVSWQKHLDNIGDPLRSYIQSISSAITTAFENMYGTAAISMVFVQAGAPTGWTQQTNFDDRVLKMSGDIGAQTGGDWEISGLDFSVTMPEHQHGNGTLSVNTTLQAGSDVESGNEYSTSSGATNVTGQTGGVQDNPDIEATIDSDGDWRPKFVTVIRANRSFA